MAYQKDKKRFHGKFDRNIFEIFKNKAKSNGYYLSAKLNDLLKEYIQNNKLLNLEFQRNENEKVSKSVYLEEELDGYLNKLKNTNGTKKIEVLETLMKEYIEKDEEIKEFEGHQAGKIQSSYKIDHNLYDQFSEKATKEGKAVVDEFNQIIKTFLSNSDKSYLKEILNNPNLNLKKEKYNIFIKPELKEELKKKSKKYKIKMSDIINAALYHYIM
jgi:hypothetical protein